MAQRPDAEYHETNDPNNPPRAVVNRNVRRAALWVYVGPLVVLMIFLAIAFLYWSGRDPADSGNQPVGTGGEQMQVEPRRDESQDRLDPSPRPDSTEDEVEFRNGTDPR